MPRGGPRPGAGRPRRPGPKAKPIWIGPISEDQRQYIIERLSPQERLVALLDAAKRKEGRADGEFGLEDAAAHRAAWIARHSRKRERKT